MSASPYLLLIAEAMLIYNASGKSINKENAMFCKHSDNGYKEALDGIKLKTLVYGEKTLFAEYRLEKQPVAVEVFSPVREDYLPDRPATETG
jgi:hypothetical protein